MAKLTPELWGLTVNEMNHLTVGDVDAIELTEKYGTPVYIVNEERLRHNYNRFQTAFKSRYANVEVSYSYKTNCIPGVLNVLHETGAKAEVISGYELWLARRLGVRPDSIIFNGPNKTQEELRTAIKQGIKLINADSLYEIEAIDKISAGLGLKANLGIRVNPGIVPKGMSVGTATGSRKAQFGVDLKTGEALQAFRRASALDNVNLLGMHCHIGSGVKDPRAYVIAVKRMLKLAGEVKRTLGKELNYLDLGGGFGTPGHHDFRTFETFLHLGLNRMPSSPDPASCPGIEVFAEMITEAIRNNCAAYGVAEPTLILEPGRYITGDTQILLIKVKTIKDRPGIAKFAIAEGGILSTSLMLVAEYHHVFLANKMHMPTKETYRVYGRVCTSADFLYKGIRLPTLEEGDVLAVMDTGAYFLATSTNFAYPRPPVVMAKNGRSWLIRAGESFEDLIRNDVFAVMPP